jgi:hypothetical protein
VSKYPLGEAIQNPEAKGRIAKWALELMGQNISYTPPSAIKCQVLAYFVAVTPVFPKKTKCLTICMPGSSSYI